jgi:RHS repeat-associated protein
VVTTQTGTAVWDWPVIQNPFGERAASGNGYNLNLRFPGQYFDAETGLHYNYFRDYEPSAGRYVQSDPMGLDGDIGTFVYVKNRPLSMSDFYGLTPDSHQLCMQLGLGVSCQSVYGFGQAESLTRVVRCAELGAEKCIAVCALKNFVGINISEISRNVGFEAAKAAAERMAKKKAIAALEHTIPVVGWLKTVYDGIFTWKCSWECAKK